MMRLIRITCLIAMAGLALAMDFPAGAAPPTKYPVPQAVVESPEAEQFWAVAKLRKAQDSLHILDIASIGNHLWAVTAQGSLLHSDNQGLSWERRKAPWWTWGKYPGALRQVHFLDTARGFAAGVMGQFLATEDGGKTWEVRKVGEAADNADFRILLFTDSAQGFLVEKSGRVHATVDAGKSWTAAKVPERPYRTGSILHGKSGEHLTALVGMDGVIAFGRGLEGLEKVGEVPGKPDLFAVRFLDSSRGFIGGDSGFLARTLDGGRTWDGFKAASKGKVLALDFLDNRQGFAVGEKGLLFETRDAGGTWLRASRSPSERGMGSYLRFPPPGYFLLLLLVLLLVWPVLRAPKVEVVKESIADQLVSDRPLEDERFDVLGLSRKAEALAEFLANPRTEPPLTFGIMGEWGKGKSSLMNLLRGRLNRDGFTTVWFNAWHHQSEESLLASLLETIRRTRIAPWWTLDGLRFRSNLIAKRLVNGRELDWLLLLSGFVLFLVLCRWNPMGIQWNLASVESFVDGVDGKGWLNRLLDGGALLVTMFPLGISFLTFWRLIRKGLVVFNSKPSRLLADLAGKATLGDMSEKVGFREEFRREFSEVAEALRHAPLVVFIDDLDRCQPGKVMEILESINFLVTCGPCYFVVAMDKRQITRAIIVEDSQVINLFQDKGEAHAQEYLEKIINIEVPVPEPGPDSYKRLMTLQEAVPGRSSRISDARWQETLKNLPIYLVLGFLLYLSGSLLRAPAAVPILTGLTADTLKTGSDSSVTLAGTPVSSHNLATQGENASNPTLPTGIGLEAALPFAWDPISPPVFLSGTQAPWTRPFAVAIPALCGALLAWAALAWIFQRRRRTFRDSQDFLQAVDAWHPLIFLGARTPRAVKKFLNRLRFFAVLRRNTPLDEGRSPRLGDGELVALASVELGLRTLREGKDITPENLREFEDFLRQNHPQSPLANHLQVLLKREDMSTLLKEFSDLGANVRVNA